MAENSPISLSNGQWTIKDRKAAWDQAAKYIYDDQLSAFEKAAIEVLGERDPSFEIDQDQRWFRAGVEGKVLSHSAQLREGMAEALALMGVFPDSLVNCNKSKVEGLVVHVMRETLCSADWILWGSLGRLLPILAEAEPELFFQAVETGLWQNPSPFSVLFKQEGDGVTGQNYLTGLFYALETLAWEERYLVRVCMILGGLAAMDPGGRWANRPSNSLVTILLPWLPQTMASIDKRKTAVRTLFNEYPKVASRLAFNLLPNQVVTSSPTRRPVWRGKVPEDFPPEISREDYFQQVSNYAELLIDWAGYEPKYLNALAEQLHNLPAPSFERLLAVLSSEEMQKIQEEDRLLLWNTLTRIVRRHRRLADASWVIQDDLLEKVDRTSERFMPSDPTYRYRVMFSGRDYDLYDDSHDIQEQASKLEEKRVEAVKEIFGRSGLDGILQFVAGVEQPHNVGYSFGSVANDVVDTALLPSLLNEVDKKLYQFVRAYICRRHQLLGWEWAEAVVSEDWEKEAIAIFLGSLPFEDETWKHVNNWLAEQKGLYWRTVQVNAYQADEHFEKAVQNLLDSDRAAAAVELIYLMYFKKKDVDPNLAYRALIEAGRSKNLEDVTSAYSIVEVIGKLQETPGFSEDKLIELEWAYLPLLEDHMKASPKLLERKLASDPELFCLAIQTVYRPDGGAQEERKTSEEEQVRATNVWRLLRNWRIVPGTKDDGGVDGGSFNVWLQKVHEACEKSGHLSSALHTVGFVLIHSPKDESGLWIKKEVAGALNRDDAEAMRRGYWSAVINSRGAHWVDPAGKPEKELAQQFNQKAEDVENEGFHRFAITLRGIAEFYDKEAERVIDQNKRGGEES